MRSSIAEVQERRRQLLNYLISVNETTIEQLAIVFSVSTLTIRRDIEEFRANGQVTVRNGVVVITEAYRKKLKDNSFSYEKKQIQRKAANLVENRDVLFINTSYTALGILEYITDVYCTVVTNNTHILDLNLGPNISVILTGGEVRQPRSSLSGEYTLELLRKIRANKCFIGVDGVCLDGGSMGANGLSGELSCAVHHEAIINEMMLQYCTGKKYVVVTSDRLSHTDRFSCGSLSMVSGIITDHLANPLLLTDMKALGIEVILG